MAEENQLHIEDLIYWLNQARLNPQSLIVYLETHLMNFRNQRQLELSPHSFLLTFEGKKAWHEAIQFLQIQNPTDPLVRHQGLNRSSIDHAKDLAANEAMGDIGSDGSTLQTRIKRHCKLDQGIIGQTVAQEYKKKIRNHARQTILSLIISDGDTTRKTRQQIFNPGYRFFGICDSDKLFELQSSPLGLIKYFIDQNKQHLKSLAILYKENLFNHLYRFRKQQYPKQIQQPKHTKF